MRSLAHEREPIYRQTMSVVTLVYRVGGGVPAEEKSGLGASLRRAASTLATSVTDALGKNDVDGIHRATEAGRAQIREMLTLLDLSLRMKVIPKKTVRKLRKTLVHHTRRLEDWHDDRIAPLEQAERIASIPLRIAA